MENKQTKQIQISGLLQKYALLFAAILLCVIFGAITPTFWEMGNIMNILSSSVIL